MACKLSSIKLMWSTILLNLLLFMITLCRSQGQNCPFGTCEECQVCAFEKNLWNISVMRVPPPFFSWLYSHLPTPKSFPTRASTQHQTSGMLNIFNCAILRGWQFRLDTPSLACSLTGCRKEEREEKAVMWLMFSGWQAELDSAYRH